MRPTLNALAPALLAALLAGTAPAASGKDAGEIARAFEAQGMAAERSRCYGRTIARNLDPDGRAEAARIVSTAGSGTEIEEDVKAGGLDMVEAFLAARTACGT